MNWSLKLLYPLDLEWFPSWKVDSSLTQLIHTLLFSAEGTEIAFQVYIYSWKMWVVLKRTKFVLQARKSLSPLSVYSSCELYISWHDGVSPNQAIVCTCPFTGSNQPFNPQLDICPYLQERVIKSFIL